MTDSENPAIPASDAQSGLPPVSASGIGDADPTAADVETRDAGLDGHTIEELSDYLDRDRTPADPSIDQSPGCQIALRALERLSTVSAHILEIEAEAEPARDSAWIEQVLSRVGIESRAGRNIPYRHTLPLADLHISEGAVRGIVREAGDQIDGVLIGRVHLDGDVTVPDEPITVRVDVSLLWGRNIPETANRTRQGISDELRKHTELNITAIDVTVHDIQASPISPQEDLT